MASPLIATKLHVPSRRPSTVSRPRLTDRLSGQAQLTLIAAPAGFGKTSVLTEWLTTLGVDSRVAWVSLDERDNDNDLFWRYVISALDRAAPGVGTAALKLLASPSAPLDATVATLINDLDAASTRIVLVLDDYHVIENAAIQTGMELLLGSLPANIRLVLASRADPALPLARLRSRGELIELRAADLRFRPEESAEYLSEVMGIHLRDDDVETLGDRTEGWIAAIQLAALSMQGRDDAADFIAGFAGDDRYVVDYLVEEVLERQPNAVRRFLLETSILSVLTGDLCDAVTGESGGSDTLEALERANLFVVPLDDHRESYRYHHLFAEMLRARLLNELPERVGELHLRASKWFEQHGQTTEAIGHAIEGGSFDRAAEMIAAAMPVMQQNRQETTLVRWHEMLPAEIVRTHPALSIGFAGSLMSAGKTDGVDALLLDAEAAIGGTSDQIRAIRSGVALYRAAQALVRGDLETAYEQGSVAVVLSQDGGHIDRGSSNGILGLVQWSRGDLSAARAAWTISLNELLLAGHRSDVLGGSLAMADIQLAQGHLGDARDTYRRGLDLAATAEPQLRGAADMHVGMCDLLRERGDLEGAHRHLAAAEALGEYAGLPQNRHRRRIAAALLLHSEGDPAAAISVFDEAEQVYTPDFFPDVRPIPALRARAMLAAGDNASARDWADRSGLTVDDTLTYLREFEHITFARVLLSGPPDARRIRDANALLARLLAAAEESGRAGRVLEILILRALALHHGDQREDALDALRDAVDRAEPEGYLRAFADEGEPMARLLAALAKRDGWNAYLRTLHTAASGQQPHRSTSQGLIDPLSDRELDVLRLLGSELGGPEISRELVVSLNTLRTHTKNIYAKLGVTSRREAVRRAAELGIFTAQ
jgi:LuxR family transcriptional regulator, maltose regulon positive regulatory protein